MTDDIKDDEQTVDTASIPMPFETYERTHHATDPDTNEEVSYKSTAVVDNDNLVGYCASVAKLTTTSIVALIDEAFPDIDAKNNEKFFIELAQMVSSALYFSSVKYEDMVIQTIVEKIVIKFVKENYGIDVTEEQCARVDSIDDMPTTSDVPKTVH